MLPGYKNVREFGPDDKYEDEEEEVCYVTLDLGHDVDKTLVPSATEYRLVGLDTETPMLQLHGSFFIGTHEELIGTELLFEEAHDEANPSKRSLAPFGMTEQRIRFRQVEIKPKDDPLDDDAELEPGLGSSAATTTSKTKAKRAASKSKPKARKSSKAKGKERARDVLENDEEDELEEEDVMDIDDIPS